MYKRLSIGIIVIFCAAIIISVVWYVYFRTNANSPQEQVSLPQGEIEISPQVPKPDEMNAFAVKRMESTIDEQVIVTYAPENDEDASVLIVYSHGSNEHIAPEIVPDGFAEAITKYGDFFAQNGGVFIVSEMFGENWGTTQSQEHIAKIIDEAEVTYINAQKTCLFGFSMGGLPTLRAARKYPEEIDCIALLAPTIADEDWSVANLEKIAGIPITIWHGTNDVNVPITVSQGFVAKVQEYGLQNVIFNEVSGETHRHFLAPEELLEFFTKG